MPAAVKNRPLARGDACQGCKARKVRCPAERPSCANCVKRKRECVYNSSPSQSYEATTTLTPDQPQSQPLPELITPPLDPVPSSSRSSFSNTTTAATNTNINGQLPTPGSFPTAGPSPVIDSSDFGSFLEPDTHWMSDLGMIGVFPWTSGNDQTVPSPHTHFDISALMRQDDISTGALDPRSTDVTDAERDHLLLLYFTNQRVFGFDMHIATFYQSLQLADPAGRPHPCLLNAMYLVTCRVSPVESLRQKESLFYSRAKEQMDAAIGKDGKMFDAMRAGTLITCYLFASQRHAEAWAMLGQTVHITIACGLDRLDSSVGFDYEPSAREKRRGLGSYIQPPASQLELADRIHAFWAIFLVDRCAAIALEWPAGFDQDRISTPLPRPWAEYETNDAHLHTCDERLSDLFAPLDQPKSKTCQIDHHTDFGHIIQAIALMHRSSIRPNKTEQEFILGCLKRWNGSLPDTLRQPQRAADGSINVTAGTASLQMITLCTEIFTYSADTHPRPDSRALDAARRMIGVLHLLKDANVGDVNLFVIVLWCRVARLLIWESKVLEAANDTFAAASYTKDAQFILSFLQQLGHIPLAREGLSELKEFWNDNLEQFEHNNDNRRRASRYT
ncbi:hypothetical protein I317_05041 [Kwoniella heveanensis CBS 569]|uniref:Zn(2)-C6 fungal-type domain-containing protein n=1 Tax=Kwoniella heveanensis BCC8398 TaxID=1296120 RepID=A0A1B9GIS8_9TREE|nr:hypothetical protein I316_07504 [Kwoniella heveanensis BCC8398]OCF41127.1 hypothetical protein I317_05041 [Kwoniella heveanensis CBS 569]